MTEVGFFIFELDFELCVAVGCLGFNTLSLNSFNTEVKSYKI